MKKICLTIIFSLFILAVFAQFPTNTGFGGFGGSNLGGTLGRLGGAFSQGLGGGGANSNFHAPQSWLPDSVPLRITKFAQSALNFYQPVSFDTSHFTHFEILPPKEKFNDIWLGNLAFAWLPNEFDQRIQYSFQDFFFINPYMDRIFISSDNFFFRTNRPFTDLYYASSFKNTEQQAIHALHSQNVDYYTNFGLIYNDYTAKGIVRAQDNSGVSSVVFWIAKYKPSFRYHLVMFTNTIKILQNGGIIDTSAEFNPFMNYSYYLTKAFSRIGYKGISFDPEIQLFKTKDSVKLFFQSFTKYSFLYHKYYDQNPASNPAIYGHFFADSALSNDSVNYQFINQAFRLKLFSPIGNAEFSYGALFQNFYYFTDYIFRPVGRWYPNFYIKAGIQNIYLKKLQLSAAFKYFLAGRLRNQFAFNSQIKYHYKNIFSGFQTSIWSEQPGFYISFYNGNTDRWKNNFLKQFFWQNRLYLSMPKFKFSTELQYWMVKNYINFLNGYPVQYQNLAHILIFKLHKTFTLGPLNFDNSSVIQLSNKNQIFNLPLLMNFNSLWLNFYIFHRAAQINTGFDVYFTTKFYQYFYKPSIEAFYINYNQTAGMEPIVNIFFNMHVKRMYLFFKFDYVNGLIEEKLNIRPYYSTATHYHYPVFYYRFGARWWFKN